jgi:hypothetical protein
VVLGVALRKGGCLKRENKRAESETTFIGEVDGSCRGREGWRHILKNRVVRGLSHEAILLSGLHMFMSREELVLHVLCA